MYVIGSYNDLHSLPSEYIQVHSIVYTIVTDHRVISDRMCTYDMYAYDRWSDYVVLRIDFDGGRGTGL